MIEKRLNGVSSLARTAMLAALLMLPALAGAAGMTNAVSMNAIQVDPDTGVVTIEVMLSVDTDLSLLNLHIGYDPECLQIRDAEVVSDETHLTALGTRPVLTGTADGSVKWTAGRTKGDAVVKAGAGPLVYLWFDMVEGCADTSTVLTWERVEAFDNALKAKAFDEVKDVVVSLEPASSYTVTYEAGANGDLVGSTSQIVADGDDAIAVRAAPDRGYRFMYWLRNGVEFSAQNPLRVTDVQADMHFAAVFDLKPHAADQNGNWRIDMAPELSRLIQFINSGGYHYAPGSEDGYAPGSGDRTGTPHAGDQDGDWRIDIARELSRIIQFINSGGYHLDPDSEDGYAPGRP